MKLKSDLSNTNRRKIMLKRVLWGVVGFVLTWCCVAVLLARPSRPILEPVWELRLNDYAEVWLLDGGRVAYSNAQENECSDGCIRVVTTDGRKDTKADVFDSNITNLVSDDNMDVYIITKDNKLSALDKELNTKWSYQLANEDITNDIYGCFEFGIGDDELIYCVTSTGLVTAINKEGREIRRFQAIPGIDPVADSKGRLLYTNIGKASDTAYTVMSVWDGPNEVSSVSLPINTQHPVWLRSEQKFIYMHSGKIECISEDAQKLWEYELPAVTQTSVLMDRWMKVFDEFILVAQDNNVVAIDFKGDCKWQTEIADHSRVIVTVLQTETGIILQCKRIDRLYSDLLPVPNKDNHEVMCIDTSGTITNSYLLPDCYEVVSGFDECGACYAMKAIHHRCYYRLVKLVPNK